MAWHWQASNWAGSCPRQPEARAELLPVGTSACFAAGATRFGRVGRRARRDTMLVMLAAAMLLPGGAAAAASTGGSSATLPDVILAGYANWGQCDEGLVQAARDGMNVLI
eukprot:COSAG03_NODE_9264_length_733_cov_3.422713_1_plen_109_part_01